MLALRTIGILTENEFAGVSLTCDKVKTGFTQCLPQCLVCHPFGMLEHFRLILSLAGEFRQFHFVRLPVTAYAQCQVEIGMEIIRHGIAVIEVVRHDKVADIHHHLLRTVCKVGIPFYVIMVDGVLHLAGFFGERLKIRAHQLDVNGIVILPPDGELVSGIGFLEPGPYQFHNFGCVLPLVITAFPTVFVMHILCVLLCRSPGIVVFVAGGIG